MSTPETYATIAAGVAIVVVTFMARSINKCALFGFGQYLLGAVVVGYGWLFVALDIGFDRVASEGLSLWPRYGWWGLFPVMLIVPYIICDVGFREDVAEKWWILLAAIVILLVPILGQVTIIVVAAGTTIGLPGAIIELILSPSPGSEKSSAPVRVMHNDQ